MELQDFSQTFYNEADTTVTIKQISKGLKANLKRKFPEKDNEWLNNTTEKILEMNGIDFNHFNFIHVIEKVISERLNDVSIDDNSNKNEKTIAGIFAEAIAPIKKVVGFDYLYRTMKEMYGKPRAKRLASNMYDYSIGLSDSTNVLLPYCYALDASKLVTIGREFGQLPSKPAKRISSYISALCETVHQMSSHFAGAIAIGTFFFDVAHLAFYKQGLSIDQITNDPKCRKHFENEYQQFIHSVNHLSRNSNECVTSDTEVLTPSGFKTYDMLNVGDDIYTWNNGVMEVQKVQRVNVSDYDGIMHQYKGRDYNQVVTPNHRVLRKKYNSKEFELIESSKIFNNKTPESLPVAFSVTNTIDYDISDDLLQLATIVFCDGTFKRSNDTTSLVQIFKSDNRYGNQLIIDLFNALGMQYDIQEKNNKFGTNPEFGEYKFNAYVLNVKTSQVFHDMFNGNKKILPSWFTKLSQRQARLVIDTWKMFDGHCESNNYNKTKLQCDNYDIANVVQHIAVIAGYGSKITERIIGNNVNPTIYLNIYNRKNKDASQKNEVYYKGKVWCPTTENGVVVFRKDGRVFISGNSPFTNVSIFDKVKLKHIIKEDLAWYFPNPHVGSKIGTEEVTQDMWLDFMTNYIYEIQNIFLDLFDKGDPMNNGVPYRFPVVTTNFSKSLSEDGWKLDDEEFLDNITSRDVYRYNVFNSEGTKVASCCRLISDTEMLELAAQSNSFGAGAVGSLGSHRVATINFNRIALEAQTIEDFWKIYNQRIIDTKDILKAHKTLIHMLANKGLQMFISNGWINMKRMFSTFGIMGIYECEKTLRSKFDIVDDYNITKDILMHLNSKVIEFTKSEEGYVFNIEQIPGESYAVRLCTVDKMLYGEELVPCKLYANQWVPLWEDATIWEKLEIDGEYNSLLTGGGIVHATIGETVTKTQSKEIIRYAVKSGCEHFALNAIYSKCENGHMNFGDLEACPICAAEIVDKYTRVVGFFVPVSSMNKTRREWEFPRRTKAKF